MHVIQQVKRVMSHCSGKEAAPPVTLVLSSTDTVSRSKDNFFRLAFFFFIGIVFELNNN